jgi:hypothetical protein
MLGRLVGGLVIAVVLAVSAFSSGLPAGQATADAAAGDVTYTVQTGTSTWDGVAYGTLIDFRNDDDSRGELQFGFGFPFYLGSYSGGYVSTNGLTSLGDGISAPASGCFLLDLSPSAPASVPFGRDLTPGLVYYSSSGTTPNRRFEVQYQGMKFGGTPGTETTFRALLFESGDIAFEYYAVGSSDPVVAIGLQGNDLATEFAQYRCAAGGNPVESGKSIRFTRVVPPTATPSPTETSTPTASATASPTPSETPTASVTPPASGSPTPTATPTATLTPSATPARGPFLPLVVRPG